MRKLPFLVLMGCSAPEVLDDRGGEPPSPAATQFAVVAPLLDGHCVSCHNGERAQADLDLESPGTRDRLLANTVTCIEGTKVFQMPAVTPGNLQNSALWIKLKTNLLDEKQKLRCGREMPARGTSLSVSHPEDFALVERWIVEGAN